MQLALTGPHLVPPPAPAALSPGWVIVMVVHARVAALPDGSGRLTPAIVLPSGKEILISGQYQKTPTFGPYTLPEATDVGWKDGMYAAVIDQGNTLWAWGRGDGANDLMIKGVATHDGSAFLGTLVSARLEHGDTSELLQAACARSPSPVSCVDS